MTEPTKRKPVRRRPWWRRNALPRSRPALVLGALVAVALVVLLVLALARAQPGSDVPAYDPATASTTSSRGQVSPPIITAGPSTTPRPTVVRGTTSTTTTPQRP